MLFGNKFILMIRKTYLVKRSEIFDWLEKPKVVKIDIVRSDNKTLRDGNICRIHVYYKIIWGDLYSLFGMCYTEHKKHKIPYLSGVVGMKRYGYITSTMIKKLKIISEKQKINLGIPLYFLDYID